MKRYRAAWVLFLFGCSPSLDWRDVRPEGTTLLALFPCKPSSHVRNVRLLDAAVDLSLYACSADGKTFGVGHADVGDPSRVGMAMDALAGAAAANIRAAEAPARTLAVPGMTPNAKSRRVTLTGTLPDGGVVTMEVAVFSSGTRVFQATVLGSKPDRASIDTFIEGLRLIP